MADQIFSAVAGFFDAVGFDRTYSADDMNKPYSRIVADGVFATPQGTPSTDLQVIAAGTGMNITVQAGQGIFAKKWFENPTSIAITVPNNTSLFPRIDSVIVQIDKRVSGRIGNIVYRTGTPATSPNAPDINTVANVVEYRLANISVPSGVLSINQAYITDLRGSSACPWVAGLIEQVDTSTLMLQYQAAYKAYYDAATKNFEEYTADQREAWEEFLKTLTEELTVSMNVAVFTSTFTPLEDTTEAPINIASFDPYTDILQVFINGLLAVEDTDYTVSADHTKITLTDAVKTGNDVNFIVFKSLIGTNIGSAVTMMQKIDNEVSTFMNDSGWVSLEIENGEAVSGNAPAFRCIGNRFYLRGAVKGVTDLDTAIATLPVSYWPEKDHVYSSSAVDASGVVNDDVTITISATDGTIKLTAKSGELSADNSISLATAFLSAQGNTVSLVYNFKGAVVNYSNLPTDGVKAGDVYMVLVANPAHHIQAGDDVMWNGSGWEILQAVISSAEIDEIINSIS